MASERVEAPRRAHDGHQAIMPATKIDGLGGEVHANARRQRQHRDRRASTNAATYATSVPGSKCTCRLATWITISRPAGGSREMPGETATGRRRIAVSLPELRRDAPSFHRHQYNVERRSPRRWQNDSTTSPDPDRSSRRADHCSGVLRARMHARTLVPRPLGRKTPRGSLSRTDTAATLAVGAPDASRASEARRPKRGHLAARWQGRGRAPRSIVDPAGSSVLGLWPSAAPVLGIVPSHGTSFDSGIEAMAATRRHPPCTSAALPAPMRSRGQ